MDAHASSLPQGCGGSLGSLTSQCNIGIKRNLKTSFVLLLLLSSRPGFAQDDPVKILDRLSTAKNEIERDRGLRRGFEAALAGNPDAAVRYLPLVIDRPWLGEMNFHAACALARTVEDSGADGATAEKLVLAAGLHNPELALRETGDYLALSGGPRLFARFVSAAPDQAMGLALGPERPAQSFRNLLSQTESPEMAVLIRIAAEPSIDLPRRERLAILAGTVAHGGLSFDDALRIAGNEAQFFAKALDLRAGAPAADAAGLERALTNESLELCRAAQESPARILASLTAFRTRDLYALLALGRAEATPEVFAAVFDRLLLPKWKGEMPKGRSLVELLDQTKNWELRDFAAGALAAHRFAALLAIAGRDLVDRLVRRIDQTEDPLREGMRLAELADAITDAALRNEMATIVAAEFARCRGEGDLRGATVYGLLAAKLALNGIGDPYLPFFRSSETLDTALLFGTDNDCIERHFFYDDDDGVESFASFRSTYQRDPAWKIEDRGQYVHLLGGGPQARRIEIYANVPIDTHLPKNRPLEGEAQRRQQAITEALAARGVKATVVVHRGHSFWTERTLSYVAPSARLVILGSCRGTTEVHTVIEASHDAQVIATRGVGATEINDVMLKAVNDRILNGDRLIEWSSFWRDLSGRFGNSRLFRDYVAPNQDAGTVFLRSYYRFLDAVN